MVLMFNLTKCMYTQENIDAKHQIRRPEIGCKLNKLADRTHSKVTHYPLNSFLPRCYFFVK